MSLLRKIFVLRSDTAGDDGLPQYSNLYPPTVKRTLYYFSLRGRISHMKLVYVTLAPIKTLCYGMK